MFDLIFLINSLIRSVSITPFIVLLICHTCQIVVVSLCVDSPLLPTKHFITLSFSTSNPLASQMLPAVDYWFPPHSLHGLRLGPDILCQSVFNLLFFIQCHFHTIISWFIKIQIGLNFLVPAYPGCPAKEAIKRVSCFCLLCSFYFSVPCIRLS